MTLNAWWFRNFRLWLGACWTGLIHSSCFMPSYFRIGEILGRAVADHWSSWASSPGDLRSLRYINSWSGPTGPPRKLSQDGCEMVQHLMNICPGKKVSLPATSSTSGSPFLNVQMTMTYRVWKFVEYNGNSWILFWFQLCLGLTRKRRILRRDLKDTDCVIFLLGQLSKLQSRIILLLGPSQLPEGIYDSCNIHQEDPCAIVLPWLSSNCGW